MASEDSFAGGGQQPGKPGKGKNKTQDNPSERDTLSREELQARYQYTAAQLAVDKGLFDLFEKAFEGQWSKERFLSEVQQLDWYRENAASVRTYMLLKAEGGADFTQKQADTREAVRQQAMKQGYNLSPEQIDSLTEQSMMYGWGERPYLLQQAIGKMQSMAGQYGGDVGGNVDNLKAIALANNVKLDEQWFLGKAQSIAAGMSLADDVERNIRELAAQRAPVFAKEIMAGQNLDALVSPWRSLMAEEWELGAQAITLDDPMIQKAIGGFSQDGTPTAMNLGEFQMLLRKDPRWMQTTKAQNSVTSTFADVMKMFGVGN